MKKRMILITLTLLVIAIAISVYIAHRPHPLLSVQEQIPAPKLHEHIAPDGTVIEHLHTYELPEPPEKIPGQNGNNAEVPIVKKSPWVQQWEKLDLAAIKRDYQPYTVAEMRKMWDQKLLDEYTSNNISSAVMEKVTAADTAYPLDEYLARMLRLGFPFVNLPSYRIAFQERISLLFRQEEWYGMDTYERSEYLEKRGLPADATWEVCEDHFLKRQVVHSVKLRRAWDVNPSLEGGVSIDGVFMPFLPNTVHVHISEDSSFAQFAGVKLTRKEKSTLKMYGIAPKGINVIYVDENNEPLPSGAQPLHLYERKMKALKEAQNLLQQQIEDHELLLELDTLLNPSEEKEQIVTVPDRHDNVRQIPQGPEVPLELYTQDEINRWFTALEALHGGKLPKDLKALQKVITELEKIRQDAERKLKPAQRPIPFKSE